MIQIDNVLVSPSSKNVNAITLFMNGMPPKEIERAIPFVKIEFMFGRAATDGDGRLQAMSLFKFLEGATNEGLDINHTNSNSQDNPLNATRRLLVDANTVSGSISGGRGDSDFLTTAGLELFCAPQTLVNADETYNPSLRAVPVLDKFRPFMTFKSLTVDLAPAAGLMSYKTAKMEFTLHDRSRLHEIADFIKPDLYGTTELLLEYGWNHPDMPSPSSPGASRAERDVLKYNPYGALINGMRSREKYGIRNMSAVLDEAGQINVTLDLFMKGGSEFKSETIASSEEGTGNVLREIEDLARTITAYERRYFSNTGNGESSGGSTSHAGGHQRTREIRGRQILESASDWQTNLQLSPALLTNLREFKQSVQRGSASTTVRPLIDALNQLYGNERTGAGGQEARLLTTTQESIRNKVARMTQGSGDPFLVTTDTTRRADRFRGRVGGVPGTRYEQGAANAPRIPDFNIDNLGPLINTVSFGKLLVNFIGVPLAMTHKFDDIQFVFYPFNKFAGKANTMNISQFPVDTRYFIQQYARFRTENAARAANMSLGDFVSFLATTIIDDPGATAYGIHSLYQRVVNRSTGTDTLEVSNRFHNSLEFQTQLEQTLRGQCPDGTFKMPVVDFHIECLPGKAVTEGQTTETLAQKSILRVHVYDKQNSAYESQAGILASCRDDLLNSMGAIPQTAEITSQGIHDSHAQAATSIIQIARDEGLIEPVRDRNGGDSNAYRITRGPSSIKDFVMTTMPYIIYGIQGTMVRGSAALQTMQDSALSTVNMLQSFRASPLEANGEQPGGLPLSVIPTELNLPIWGCPLIDFAQQFFIDFQTGTTWDNIYGVIGVNHKITPGEFVTDIKFAPLDAYGKYNSLIEQVNVAANRLDESQQRQ